MSTDTFLHVMLWDCYRLLTFLVPNGAKEELRGPRHESNVNMQLTDFELFMPLLRSATRSSFEHALWQIHLSNNAFSKPLTQSAARG